jgi:hypothetical protein
LLLSGVDRVKANRAAYTNKEKLRKALGGYGTRTTCYPMMYFMAHSCTCGCPYSLGWAGSGRSRYPGTYTGADIQAPSYTGMLICLAMC